MAVRIPKMKEFLFGCTIRTGSIVIASVCLVTAIVLILPSLIYGFGAIEEAEQGFMQPTINGTSIKWNVGLTIFTCLIQAILSAILLAGILKKIRCLLLPWLIISGITFILLIIALLYNVIAPLIAWPQLGYSILKLTYANEYIKSIVTLLFGIVISAYTTCIVYGYFAELKEYQEVNKRQTQA